MTNGRNQPIRKIVACPTCKTGNDTTNGGVKKLNDGSTRLECTMCKGLFPMAEKPRK
ncbi:hypothetical protein KKF81_06865 [Candidatus Micrarchaeota archaeon]|nr:hypothetical protein [Candidatus Micrarchaeota archaeon]MBU1166651.1 hypothetical protein [Candidatus Micrarchaeota archaeon]MBU1886608.1 hypothetical protein [Candidatus Micrarchaeota archaeon]